ncbi:MAG: hypothetical protein LBF83_09755 [Spirochaetaceae bacterium]|nr:hypothetical protein [Spirochaetaceae bacterium]
MTNITLAMDEQTLALGREYAKRQNISFNALVRGLVEKTVKSSLDDWLEYTFQLMDKANVSSDGKKWKRKELYRG